MDNFPLLMILVGFGVALFARNEMREQVASFSWPTSEGKIVFIRPKGYGDYDVDGYSINLTYHYIVDGKRYVGNRIDSGGEPFLKSRVYDRKMEPYYPGRSVVVYYRPDKPHISLLEPGRPEDSMMIQYFFAGLITGVAGTGMMLWELFSG